MFGDFSILKKCKTTNARVSNLSLNNNTLHLPIFMPVATYGAMRAAKVASMPEEIILSNTYHLRNLGRNIKSFMGWKKSMLTDSGGFQIQSIPNVEVTDDGVLFQGRLFRPEDSMDIQLTLGADIIMQLDDVVNPMKERELHEKAVERSIDWLDRALVRIAERTREKAEREENLTEQPTDIQADQPLSEDQPVDQSAEPHTKRTKQLSVSTGSQILFPIIQGGLHPDLRTKSINEILKRTPIGIAIGGLSGGEDKSEFAATVFHCCKNLPDRIPRYLMGVGYPEDIVVCCALGTDMSDCVYPTRTARFGRVFRDDGDILLNSRVSDDLEPIDSECGCFVCKTYSRAYLCMLKGSQNFCMLTTVHNMYYMRELTRRIRESIEEDRFPEFIKEFMKKRFKETPKWIIEALKWVNVTLDLS